MKKGFTLAEVLITLAIIGVVAAVSIPSVISNSNQQQYKTGLRKAVSVLNSAITMNMALEGESPYDNANLFGYLMKHMSVMKSVKNMQTQYLIWANDGGGNYTNAAFYTTDGMRFEFRVGSGSTNPLYLYETRTLTCQLSQVAGDMNNNRTDICGGCGAKGLANNVDGTTKPPCLIMVDVNGDRKPNPVNINCKNNTCAKENRYKFSDPKGTRLTDLFTILITDKQAIPYGTAAQKAMYSGQTKNK